MQNPNPDSGGPRRRLTKALKRQIRKRLIAGDSAGDINSMLLRLGETPLSPSTISYHRRHPTVQKGLQDSELDVLQSGIALRSRQVEAVKGLLTKTLDRMLGTVDGKRLPDLVEQDRTPMVALSGLATSEWAILGRDVREYVKILRYLVDGSPVLAQQAVDQQAAAGRQGNRELETVRQQVVTSFIQGMFNDALEEILRENEGARLIDGEAARE